MLRAAGKGVILLDTLVRLCAMPCAMSWPIIANANVAPVVVVVAVVVVVVVA